MDDELTNEGELPVGEPEDILDVPEGSSFGEKAGKAAMSTLLAVSLVGALSEPPRTELVTLPEPTPIVRVYQDEEPEEPMPDPDIADDERATRRRRLLRLLRFLLIALLIAATLIFGLLKGCASCSAGLLVPDGEDQQQEQTA